MKKAMPYTLYRVLACILAVCIFILGVSAVSVLEDRYYLKLDVSESGVSELSNYTLEQLEALSTSVSVFTVWSPSNTSFLRDLQEELMKRMSSVCENIRYRRVVPEQEPLLLSSLNGSAEGIPDGTCFVSDSVRNRVIRLEAEDFLFSRRIGEEQYTVFCGEARIIGAITAVCLDKPVRAVFSAGHGEAGAEECSRLALQLQAMGATVENGSFHMMDLKTDDLLLIVDPQTDLTGAETDALISFLDGGGKLLAAAGMNTRPDHLKNLCAVLDIFGLGIKAGRVTEAPGAEAYFTEEPDLLSPTPRDIPGNGAVLTGRLILPRACALAVPAARPGVTHRTLLESSPMAVLHADTFSDGTDMMPGDESGKMKLAVISESSADARVFLLSSADMLRDEPETTARFDLQDASDNLNFLAGMIRYMIHREVNWSLDAGVRQLPDRLIVFENEQVRRTAEILLMTVLPGTMLMVMAFVLLRRRHRT